jgi:hypothetical protein
LIFFPFASICQSAAQDLALARTTIDIPDYVFEHEEPRATSWRLDAANATLYTFAYLVVESPQPSSQGRAIILVDNFERPTKAFFLTGSKLLPVPEVKGKSLGDRIDRALSDSSRLVFASGPLTINIQQSNQNQQITFRAYPALRDYYEKFEDAPCLTLPDVFAMSRGTQTVEFVALLKNEKPKLDFDPRCGRFTNNLVPPAYSYITGPRLRFAFTKRRIVIRHKNYVLSIPYDVDDDVIKQSPFLISERRLKAVLTEFQFPMNPNVEFDASDDQVKKDAFAVQHRIDEELTSSMKTKGVKR